MVEGKAPGRREEWRQNRMTRREGERARDGKTRAWADDETAGQRVQVRRSTFDGLGLADEKKRLIDGVVYMLPSNNDVGGDKTKLLSRWMMGS